MTSERASVTDNGDRAPRGFGGSELLQSHEVLRAALLLAGREIKKLNFGRRNTPLLDLMRRVYKEAGTVAETERTKIGKSRRPMGQKEDFLPAA